MSYIDQLQARYPVRKKRAQKAAFRAFALEEAQRLGYDARVEQGGIWEQCSHRRSGQGAGDLHCPL